MCVGGAGDSDVVFFTFSLVGEGCGGVQKVRNTCQHRPNLKRPFPKRNGI